MAFTYEDKRHIIQHLADHSNWTNRFSMEFFTDEVRKWQTNTERGLKIYSNESGDKTQILHEQSGAAFLLQKYADGALSVADENGQSFTITGGKLKTRVSNVCLPDITPIISSDEIGLDSPEVSSLLLEDYGVFVRFNEDGQKTLFVDDHGHKLTFAPPDEKHLKETHPGQFFHTISFNLSALDTTSSNLHDLLANAKLVVAFDLGIEPGLRTINEVDERRARLVLAEHIKARVKGIDDLPKDWHEVLRTAPSLSDLQKEWLDTTLVNALLVDVPRQFSVELRNGYFNLMTSLYGRESIWAHGHIMENAKNSNVTTLPSRSMSALSIIEVLLTGETMCDHRGNEWSYTVLNNEPYKYAQKQIKAVADGVFRIDANEFAVLRFSDHSSIIAMRTNTLQSLENATRASTQLANMIEKGEAGGDKMLVLLEQGADYRFINYERAQKGYSFANMMQERGNKSLLETLKKEQGVHNLDEIKARPDEPIEVVKNLDDRTLN